MPRYENGQVYIIRNFKDDRVYIGSTTRTLAQRMAQHRTAAKKEKSHYKLYEAFNEVGVEQFYIERIEQFPCLDKTSLHSREGHFIRLHDSVNNGLNGKIAGRTKEEYQKEYQKDRYQNDDEFRRQKIEKSREYQNDRYHNDAAFRKQKLEYRKDRYHTDDAFRKHHAERLHDWWINRTDEQRETLRQLRRDRYRNDPEYRQKRANPEKAQL